MGYAAALNEAWLKVAALKDKEEYKINFLSAEYLVDILQRQVRTAGGLPAADFAAILILHYLAAGLAGLPRPSGKWISFPELEGGKGYLSSFKKRCLDPVVNRYGDNPEGLLKSQARLGGQKAQVSDLGFIVEVFADVPVLVTFWRKDEEFLPEANMLFDESIRRIFCTEDIVVMAGFLASSL